MLTPKNGAGVRLTCGPSLVMNTIRPGNISSKEIGKGRLQSAVRHRSAEGLFALLKGEFSGMCGDMARCKERTSGWRMRDGHWRRSINLDIYVVLVADQESC
jgi:hypothetical protein